MPFMRSIKLSGLLSFSPDSEPLELAPLNVLIGPNASGKSNLIEGLELLRATPTAFAAAVRDGGGVREWLWKGPGGTGGNGSAKIEAIFHGTPLSVDLRYRLDFAASGQRVEVTDETIEDADKRSPNDLDVFFYYRFQAGQPAIKIRQVSEETSNETRSTRRFMRDKLTPDESILSQRKDSDLYPELTWVGQQFARIQTFREWSFGRYVSLRQPQPADLPSEILLPDARNLGLVLNQLEHSGARDEFNGLLSRFLPRYQRFSTNIQGGTVQFYLHEAGLQTPVSATRLSDGTIRFMAILALLLAPIPPPLLCLEEPELGLHPDGVNLLADLLVQTSTRTQLIVTTHSAELVSALSDSANSVIVCEYRGGTVLRRVEPNRLQHWLNRYRLGEIWRIGELGGNP